MSFVQESRGETSRASWAYAETPPKVQPLCGLVQLVEDMIAHARDARAMVNFKLSELFCQTVGSDNLPAELFSTV